ncbi:MAG: rhomboid family intramembrane serine protease [Prevotellaceae bacterium]|jgi:membrane associated rhomboid family serine protease|nr:rhomboid family intramembrane serine protease [Prevotellaceae bacterium]
MTASIINDLRGAFRKGNIYVRLIYINVAVFVLLEVVKIALMLFNRSFEGIIRWLEMPAAPEQFVRQPWSAVTYMFMHAGALHLLFNMLWLYWFGSLFLLFFSAKHLRGLYLLGGIAGALFYLLAFNLFPFFEPYRNSLLVGASASVLAIVAATAYREPNYTIRLLFLGAVKLKYLALAVIALDLLSVLDNNGGGHIAHLGGALAGVWFAAALGKGHDLTAWINRCVDGVQSLFASHPKKPKMKIVRGGGGRQQDYDYNARKKAEAGEIDRILDKLKKSGYESLSAAEKKTLFDASKR